MKVVRLVFAWVPFGWWFTPPESTRHASTQKGRERILPGPFLGMIETG